jgi:hypothetical protein
VPSRSQANRVSPAARAAWLLPHSGILATTHALPGDASRARKGYLVAALISAAILTPASDAAAGTYEVAACGFAPSNVNASWISTNTNDAALTTSSACGSGGDNGGLVARDLLGAGSVGTAGSNASWTFGAATGTTIASIAYDRLLYSNGDSGWLVQLRTGSGTVLDDCSDSPAGSTSCTKGVRGGGSTVTYSAGDTSRLEFGVWCPSGCTNGAAVQRGHAVIYGARVTITDATAPTVSAVSGDVAAGGWLRGSVAASFSASDVGGGVKTLRLNVDGTTRVSADVTCDYTLAAPCAQGSVAWNGSALNTTALSDGTHQLRGQAVDAGGGVGSGTQLAIRVDNTAPTSATLGYDAAPSAETSRTITLTPAAPDAGSPVTTRRLRVCRADGSSCASSQDLPPAQTSVTVTLPEDGQWIVRTWDVDQAGNESAALAHTGTLTLDRTPAPPAGGTTPTTGTPATNAGLQGDGQGSRLSPPTEVTRETRATKRVSGLRILSVRRVGTTLRVSGVIAAGAGRVKVRLRVRDNGRRTVTATVRARHGRWTVTLRLPPPIRRLVRGGTVTASVAATRTVLAGVTRRRIRAAQPRASVRQR